MTKTSIVPKNKRGSTPAGEGIQIGARWHPSEVAAIDAWITTSSDQTLTRAHAVRRLVALALRMKSKATQSNEDHRLRAREMASHAIDRMTDTTAHPDDQAVRKRRLIKGPAEFREARVDRRKIRDK